MIKATLETSTTPSGQPRLQIVADGPIITAEMPTEDWFSFYEHPRHRGTRKHARAQHWRFAKEAKGAVQHHLRHVIAARWDGTYYKVDGHVRAYLWETGELAAPETLHVTIYKVTSLSELNHLYSALKTQSRTDKFDEVCAAYNENGLNLTSKRLKDGFIIDALNIALRGAARSNQDKRSLPEIDIYKTIRVFKNELALLDSINPQPEVFFSGIVAAALLALSSHPDSIAFFQKIAAREGNKVDGKMDPVEAVLVYVDSIRQKRASWLNAQQEDLCARTLRAVSGWQEEQTSGQEYWFKTKLRAADIAPWITRMKAAKGIETDPSL